jgi:hypothetical protein
MPHGYVINFTNNFSKIKYKTFIYVFTIKMFNSFASRRKRQQITPLNFCSVTCSPDWTAGYGCCDNGFVNLSGVQIDVPTPEVRRSDETTESNT